MFYDIFNRIIYSAHNTIPKIQITQNIRKNTTHYCQKNINIKNKHKWV